MASVLNNWIGYLDRSYQQIKSSLILKVTTSNPEMTDHSESNIFIVIISMFASIAEMLGYYIDNIAKESFIATAQRRSSVINLSTLLDYRIKARSAESADVTLIWTNNMGIPTNTPSAFTLGAGSYVEDANGNRFITLVDNSIDAGIASSVITFYNAVQVTAQTLDTTDGSQNQEVLIGATYADGTMAVIINSQSYIEVESFANSTYADFHYTINVKDDNSAYLKFGDGIKGIIPPNTQSVICSYVTTLGPAGATASGTLTDNVTLIGLPADTDATSNNAINSSGGNYYETNDEIRQNAVNSVRTLDRMVTWEDHEATAVLVAGVAKSLVDYCCGKEVDIYIAPTGGGVASSGLISTVQTEMDLKKMVTSFIAVRASGETALIIGAIVIAKVRKSITETKTQVETALVEWGSIDNQSINGNIRLSDIIGLIDNLDNVDSVTLQTLYTLPYARPGAGNVNPTLIWSNYTDPTSDTIITWQVKFTGTIFQVFKENVYLADIAIDSEYVDPDGKFSFTITTGTYTSGDQWEFKVYPYLQDITLRDFTIPTIDISNLIITVLPQSTSSRNPSC